MENSQEASPQTGAERRKYVRYNRRIAVTFTLEGQELAAQTVDISKTGALLAAPIVPTVGTQLLLNLSDRKHPDLSLFLKVVVVRVEEAGEREQRFAVEFGDVVARNPRRLRMFLDKALGISTGLIRVVGGEDGEDKAYAFSFESVHREGEERVRALQSSLFQSFDELEEADAILSNFGKTPVGESLLETPARRNTPYGTKKVGDTEPPQPVPAPPEEETSPELPGNADEEPTGEVTGELPAAPEAPTKKETKKEKAAADKAPFLKRLSSLFGGKSNGAPKGEAVIQTQRLPTIVAKNTDLPVVYRVGNTRFSGKATRLYCAGMKVVTDQKLPRLYATVVLFIPLAGARKIAQIELIGDVTRVRAEDAGDEGEEATGGLFEVRLSMRTDKLHLELYRALLERFTGPSKSAPGNTPAT